MSRRSAIILGAGVAGLSCALYLRRDGWEVTVLDPLGPAGGASFGNAGLLSPKADKELGDRYGVRPVSCGPYKFKEWERGSRIVVDRNSAFYREPGEFEQIIFQFVPDVATRQFMMMRGEADVALRLGPAEARQVKAKGLEIISINGRNIFYSLNYAKAPTDDIRVRQAELVAQERAKSLRVRRVEQPMQAANHEPLLARECAGTPR